MEHDAMVSDIEYEHNKNNSTKGSPLMSLPVELRLHIFGFVEDSNLPRTVTMAQNCIHRLEANGCPTLAALSRTCKQVHGEVAGLLYRHRKFNVDILGSDSLMALWRRNFDKDLCFLNRMQKVHLALSINTATTKLRWIFAMMEKVLYLFTGSSDLKEFTVEIREIYHFIERRRYVNLRLESLRREITREASEAGTHEKDIELDIAWDSLAFLRELAPIMR